MLVVWIILAFLASLLALLAVPVDLAFSFQRREGRREGSGTLGWLFGLVRLRLGEPKVRARVRPERPKLKRRHRRHGGGRLLRLVRDQIRRIHIRDLSMEVRLGLDDPADTGRLWAVVGPLAAILPVPPVARVAIEPEFTSEAFEVYGKGRIRIIPIQLLFVMLVFLLSPSALRALHAMRVEAR